MKPVIALFTGDSAGIGPELVSKLLDDPATRARADIVLIGNRAGFVGAPDVPIHQWAGLDAPAFERGVVGEKNGRFMLDALTVGARLVVEGSADALCGLNPHNGDNGNYGDEEGRIIAPGVALAASQGYPADGPFPADTAFVRAIRKDGQGYDGVVTMYHDQGQIAMKLMGFERGVTVQGGLPIPITTPAHGTAYDIAGKGVANPQAMKNAFNLAVRMGEGRRARA